MKDWIDIYFMNQPKQKSRIWKKKKAEMKQEAYHEPSSAIDDLAKDQLTGYDHTRSPVSLKGN